MHSRGPWKKELRDACVAIVSDSGQEVVFLMRHPERGENGSVTARGRTNEEIDANADVMVAAPDLLAACEALLADYDADRRGKELLPAVVNARAVIAIARGGK